MYIANTTATRFVSVGAGLPGSLNFGRGEFVRLGLAAIPFNTEPGPAAGVTPV
jgi:hypothetical protein